MFNQPMRLLGIITRVSLIAFVAFVNFFVLHTISIARIMVNEFNLRFVSDANLALFVGIPTLILSTLIVARYIWKARITLSDDAQRSVNRVKPKSTESLSTRDLMALLDADDVADLRAEIRESLRDRIHRLRDDDDAESSFEELLNDAAKPKRTARREFS